jgi:hypothetical protein
VNAVSTLAQLTRVPARWMRSRVASCFSIQAIRAMAALESA